MLRHLKNFLLILIDKDRYSESSIRRYFEDVFQAKFSDMLQDGLLPLLAENPKIDDIAKFIIDIDYSQHTKNEAAISLNDILLF